jgi:hypothetical protein
MSKLLIALTALVILGTGLLAWKAEAMTAPSAKAVESQSIVHKAACFGPGRWCGWGRHRVCRRWHCWCAPCF